MALRQPLSTILYCRTSMDESEPPKEGADDKKQNDPATSPGIGDYNIGVVMGEGAFGRVWYGEHKATARPVAIKVVDRVSCAKHEVLLVPALKQEQSLLRQLREAEHIVNLLSSFVDSQGVYMVLECCRGGTLQDSIQWQLLDCKQDDSTMIESSFQQEWSLRLGCYTRQILSGLLALHNLGYIHGDLKPSNVLLTETGRIRLADLGSARSLDDMGKIDINNKNACWRMTTTDYASPELLKGRVLEPSTSAENRGESFVTCANTLPIMAIDVWSLGCLLFACWMGQSPFHSASDAIAVDEISNYVRQPTTDARKTWLQSKGTTILQNAYVDEWLECILDFLHPNAFQRFRIGADETTSLPNFSTRTEVVEFLHQRLHNYLVLANQSPDSVDLSPSRSPDWWIAQEQEPLLRNGAEYKWMVD